MTPPLVRDDSETGDSNQRVSRTATLDILSLLTLDDFSYYAFIAF